MSDNQRGRGRGGRRGGRSPRGDQRPRGGQGSGGGRGGGDGQGSGGGQTGGDQAESSGGNRARGGNAGGDGRSPRGRNRGRRGQRRRDDSTQQAPPTPTSSTAAPPTTALTQLSLSGATSSAQPQASTAASAAEKALLANISHDPLRFLAPERSWSEASSAESSTSDDLMTRSLPDLRKLTWTLEKKERLTVDEDISEQARHMIAVEQTAYTANAVKGFVSTEPLYVCQIFNWQETKRISIKQLDEGKTATLPYPGGMTINLWSLSGPQPVNEGNASLNTKADRRDALIKRLEGGHDIDTQAQRDRDYMRRFLDADQVNKIQADPEYKRFIYCGSPGLLMHGNHGVDTKSPTSVLSQMLYWMSKQAREGDIKTLTHSAGLCSISNPVRRTVIPTLVGVRGLLRSLTSQLLRPKVYTDWIKLGWFAETDFLKKVKDGDFESLCSVFRSTIIDIACVVVEQKLRMQDFCIIIDGIDWLETDPHFMPFIKWLRTLSDEIEFSDLRKHIRLRYVLFHPQVSSLAEKPNLRERHLLLQ